MAGLGLGLGLGMRSMKRLLNIGKQQVLKQQMLELSKERVFYLTVLTRHAGNTDREMISHDLCLSGGQKQASRVPKLIQSCTSRIKKLFEEYQSTKKRKW